MYQNGEVRSGTPGESDGVLAESGNAREILQGCSWTFHIRDRNSHRNRARPVGASFQHDLEVSCGL